MARRTPLLKLYRKQERRVVAQDKTKTEDKAQDKTKRVFVITPIGADGSPERLHADWVLNAAIKPVFEPRGYEVFRSDTIADPAMINDAIFQHVIEDEVCVADLSFLNPNVFYELGVRHALEKPVIHIAHDAIRLPFDTAQHRVAFFNLNSWQSMEVLKAQIAGQLDTIERDGFEPSNPLTHSRGRRKLTQSADSKDKLIADLMSRVDGLENNMRSMSAVMVKSNLDRWHIGGKGGAAYDLGNLNFEIHSLAGRIISYAVNLPDAAAVDAGQLRRLFGGELDRMNVSECRQLFEFIREEAPAVALNISSVMNGILSRDT